MLNRKLAVVDPALSHQSAIQRCVDSGIDVTVYCEEGADVSFGARVEICDFNGGNCAIGDVCCVLEFIPCGVNKTEFYNSSSIKNGEILLLSWGMTDAQYREICGVISDDVASRIAGFSFPSFHQYRPTLECVLHSESAAEYFCLVRECLADSVSMLRTSGGNNLFDRLGYFWAGTCVIEAFRSGIVIEAADQLVANENTGVHLGAFAVLDALGLDKFVAGLSGLVRDLAPDDLLQQVQRNLPDVIYGMIADGLTGASSRGGFYRTYDMSFGIVAQVIDLNSGLYRALKKDASLRESLPDATNGGKFSSEVWKQFFTYVGYMAKARGAGIVKELDEVLRVGYNWRYCAEELASRVGCGSFF